MIVFPDDWDGRGALTIDIWRRFTSALTLAVQGLDTRVFRLERNAYIETDLARPPRRPGAIAVVGGEVYIATGFTPADWKQVS